MRTPPLVRQLCLADGIQRKSCYNRFLAVDDPDRGRRAIFVVSPSAALERHRGFGRQCHAQFHREPGLGEPPLTDDGPFRNS